MTIRTIALACLAGGALFSPSAALAEAFTVTDIAGREVTFDGPVERAILGEGRFIYTLAALDPENPFAHVAAWRNDLRTTDLAGFETYASVFPQALEIPFLGNLTDGTLQVETVVDLDADVMLMPIETLTAVKETGLEATLDQIGVKIVFIDFRAQPFQNTMPSLRIMGELFDREERAEELVSFWTEQTARVTDVIAAQNPERPLVFMYRAAGLGDCCGSFGTDNYGLMVEMAGGTNLGAQFIPGYTGTLNPEQVLASNPDIIVVTGSDWREQPGIGEFVNVGPGSAGLADQGRATLNTLMQQPAFTGVPAVENGEVYAIWHQFYTSPYQFVPIQRMAKWFHPDLFEDLDPEATFREFHERFLPVPYEPGYWLALTED